MKNRSVKTSVSSACNLHCSYPTLFVIMFFIIPLPIILPLLRSLNAMELAWHLVPAGSRRPFAGVGLVLFLRLGLLLGRLALLADVLGAVERLAQIFDRGLRFGFGRMAHA